MKRALTLLGVLSENELVHQDDVIEIIRVAFEDGQSNPKIKQLGWEEYPYSKDKVLIANTHFNTTYGVFKTVIISNQSLEKTYHVEYQAHLKENLLGTYNTIEEAKHACQTDFEKKVKECLI